MGNKYIFVAIDAVTRYAWAFPLKTRESKEIAEKLYANVFLAVGAPKFLMHDQASEFKSAHFKELLAELNATQKLCTAYSPTSNAFCERVHKTLLQLLRSLLLEYQDNKHWDTLLKTAISFYNFGYHRTLGNSPFYCFYGRDPNVPYDAILTPVPHHDGTVSDRSEHMATCLRLARESIAATQDKTMARANLKAKNRLDVGDVVFLRERHVARKDHKLLQKFNGPFRILELLGPTGSPGACVIKSFRTGRTKQVSLKDVRLIPSDSITKTENGNAHMEFPIFDDKFSDVPEHIPSKDIGRHDDVNYDVTVNSGVDQENADTNVYDQNLTPSTKPVAVLTDVPSGSSQQATEEPQNSTLPRSVKIAGGKANAGNRRRSASNQHEDSPIASRTRRQTRHDGTPRAGSPSIALRTRTRRAASSLNLPLKH